MKQVDQTDRREAPRIDLHMDGTIKPSRIHAPFPCIVRNISRTGATLEVDIADPIPDVFWLHLEHEGFSTECIVVRRSETALNVKFEAAPAL